MYLFFQGIRPIFLSFEKFFGVSPGFFKEIHSCSLARPRKPIPRAVGSPCIFIILEWIYRVKDLWGIFDDFFHFFWIPPDSRPVRAHRTLRPPISPPRKARGSRPRKRRAYRQFLRTGGVIPSPPAACTAGSSDRYTSVSACICGLSSTALSSGRATRRPSPRRISG